MKFTAALLLAGLAAVQFSPLAHAQQMKPGLWEFKHASQIAPEHQAQMAQMQKALENMPPERRKMMEDMMGKQGAGMSFSGGGMALKVCITKEQAERNQAPVDQNGRCTHDSKRSGNTIQTHFVCTDPASEGDVTTTLRGSEAFTNDITVRHQRNGKTETTKVSSEARWLGSDCGSVQPKKSASAK